MKSEKQMWMDLGKVDAISEITIWLRDEAGLFLYENNVCLEEKNMLDKICNSLALEVQKRIGVLRNYD